mmetsp:Transcript_11288/g.20029  ORF Transcript_11288/g.20029 Transcript_11288/m.20029 type:complete len:162 (-) Transcript_11288:82-567(-)
MPRTAMGVTFPVALAAAATATAVGLWMLRRRTVAKQEEPLASPDSVNSNNLPSSSSNRVGASWQGPIAAGIQNKVTAAFHPERLVIRDDSAAHRGHAGVAGARVAETHFQVQVVASAFLGMARLERQRKVQGLLDEEFAAGLHALELSCHTPAEAEKAAQQ